MEADTPLQIGQRVKLLNKDPIVEGTVKYIGSVEFATGTWVGLELDSPMGKNDGSVQGKCYFHTNPYYGSFVRPSALEIVENNVIILNADRNIIPKHIATVDVEDKNRIIPKNADSASNSRSPNRNVNRNTLQPNSRWFTGPLRVEGREFDASDRNILCMSVWENQCVVGSADHGLKVFDIQNGKLLRELYTKKYGHQEWVTCVDFLPNGKIVSGGMDSKLCLWDANNVRCTDLLGHIASVSCVKTGDTSERGISGSYDKCLIIWDFKKGKSLATLKGHKEAVIDFVST